MSQVVFHSWNCFLYPLLDSSPTNNTRLGATFDNARRNPLGTYLRGTLAGADVAVANNGERPRVRVRRTRGLLHVSHAALNRNRRRHCNKCAAR